MTLSPGTRLGPYEIVAPLGAGGMGEVYRARDARLGREVAVKVLPAAFSRDAERLRRFEQEARAAGLLNHPNILAIYDIGTQEGSPYVVSELLEGETLRERVTAGALPARKATEIGMQIARGLAAAHEKGIVHRDLKPENVLVTTDGRAKILDFGLAKLTRPDEGASGLTQAQTVAAQTDPGLVVGTVGYMSPEQVRGKAVDHRSDIFSFGAILYEMLSGERAFQRESAVETMSAILKEEPPEIAAANRAVSPALERLVRHCLEKSPDERFQSARDLAFHLEAVSSGSGVSGAQSGAFERPGEIARPRLRAIPLPLAVALLAVVAAAALLAGRMLWGRGSAREHGAVPAATFLQLTALSGEESFPALSPDGAFLVYAAGSRGNSDLFLQRIGGQNPINLTQDSPKDDLMPAVSPDGQMIVFRSERDEGGLYLMGATGESARRLTDFGHNPSWSPDGQEIVCATEAISMPLARSSTSQLWIVKKATGEKRLLCEGDAVQPTWSPHGDRIAYWGLPEGSGQRDIWTIPARGEAKAADAVRVTSDAWVDWNPVWSPDGRYLYFASDRGGTMNVWRIAIDEESGRVRGDPEPIMTPSLWSAHFSFSRDGTRLVYMAAETRSEVLKTAFDPDAGTVTGRASSLLSGSLLTITLDVSPDGNWIATYGSLRHEDLYVLRVDGTGLRRLTDDSYRDRRPRWMPDGRRLVFYSNRTGAYEIWSIDADGSSLTQLTKWDGAYTFATPNPDGSLATVFGNESAILDFNRPIEDRIRETLPPMSDGHVFWPSSWSRDGQRLAGTFSRPDDPQREGIALYSFVTKIYERIAERGGNPTWLRDGRRLLFTVADTLYLAEVGRSALRPVFAQDRGVELGDYALSPDNRTLYYIVWRSESDIWMANLEAPAP